MVDDISMLESDDVKDNFCLIFFDFLWSIFSELNFFYTKKGILDVFWLKNLLGCREAISKVVDTLCCGGSKIEGLSERISRVFLVVYEASTSTWDENQGSMNARDLRLVL